MAGLCNWAAAMCTYHNVEKDVEPKIKALRAAEGELRVAEKEKNAALAQLATVQASLDDMQARFFHLSHYVDKCLGLYVCQHLPEMPNPCLHTAQLWHLQSAFLLLLIM